MPQNGPKEAAAHSRVGHVQGQIWSGTGGSMWPQGGSLDLNVNCAVTVEVSKYQRYQQS